MALRLCAAPFSTLTMTLEPLLIAELLALGVLTGFLAGLLGIGGGMIMVPFLTWIMSSRGAGPDLAVKMAIATSMATIIFTSLSSMYAHHKKGAVQWPIVKAFTPGLILGAILAGLGVFSLLKGSALAIFFALFVGFSATQMFLDRKPAPGRELPKAGGMVGAGTVIGFLSGLVGAGGAFVSIPFMTWCNVPIHRAVATSAALGFPIALFNAVGYAISGSGTEGLPQGSLGYIWLPALACIAVTSMLLAPLGARTAHRLDVKRLKRIFAFVLYALASYMLFKGVSAFL